LPAQIANGRLGERNTAESGDTICQSFAKEPFAVCFDVRWFGTAGHAMHQQYERRES
jgi:hypothetical protein